LLTEVALSIFIFADEWEDSKLMRVNDVMTLLQLRAAAFHVLTNEGLLSNRRRAQTQVPTTKQFR
jgi:hypothetical protein